MKKPPGGGLRSTVSLIGYLDIPKLTHIVIATDINAMTTNIHGISGSLGGNNPAPQRKEIGGRVAEELIGYPQIGWRFTRRAAFL